MMALAKWFAPLSATFAAALGMTASAAVEWWAVPAMSGERRMPDADPTDGEKGGTVRLALAQEEYEPGSFVVKSDEDLGKVKLVLGEFRNERNGKLENAELDLKVVKVWYQCGNAWWSYFGDGGNVLCPELLLNDEDVIRVDTVKKANYARLSGCEQWLNPPGNLDDGFQCMRPEFHDAKTLQPVTLEKNVRKQFILTAHATKYTVPGLYRGKVEIRGGGGQRMDKTPSSTSTSTSTLCTIPVVLRVYDFVLPPPKTYCHPEMDFLCAAYSYSSIEHILQVNGRDEALAWKQLENVLADLAKHGQTMHAFRTGVGPESDRTLDLMQKVGMRTDVLLGAAEAADWKNMFGGNSITNLQAWAKRQADYYDRKLGHHNIFINNYGDEPNCAWYVKNRWRFDIFQREGFQFFIASQNGIFSKVGYDWGWHNASKDPCEDADAPTLWNRIGTHTHCAWYAAHHVGPENPDFNRRQYGLGCWLAGYSANCNYAHHFGPYNDRVSGYKPMVFAYGSGDGVIDTIQWEGFREGIDDIRYATEMCRLARAADATGDFELGRLGRRALMYLAKVDRAKDALDTIRGEMASYILRLRAALGKDAPAPVFFAKNEKFVPGALAKHPPDYRARFQRAPVEAQIAQLLKKSANPALAKRQAAAKIIQLDTHWAGPAPLNNGKWAEAHADYRRLRQLTSGDTNFLLTAGVALAYARACAEAGDAKEAKALYQSVIDRKAKGVTEANRFHAALRLALMGVPGETKRIADACAGAYAAYGRQLDKKALAAEISTLAKHLGGPGREEALRGVMAFRSAVFAPRAPKKTCLVRYSKTPISGLPGFTAVERLADAQRMDRPFGGDTEMLASDVATGERGAVGKGGIDPAKAPRLDILCDDWGLHLRCIVRDPDARKIETGLAAGPKIEGYVAPGEDAPYICSISPLRPGSLAFYNTAYDGRGHRRARTTDTANYRQDVAYTDDTVTYYFALSWNLYPTRIPANGSVWPFEQILWGGTSYTWNGVENVHGRSTWGQLKFELDDAARASILRKRLCKAVATYRNEKRSREMHEGVLDHWSDAVIGDLAFYTTEVKPLADELDRVCELVKPDMDDRTTLDLAAKYLVRFEDLRPEIDARRAAWLLRRQAP